MSGMRLARQTNTIAPASRTCSMAARLEHAGQQEVLASGASWRTSAAGPGPTRTRQPSISHEVGAASRTA